ncbi:MAG: hypothetical protein B7Z16_05035 [Algoriphagus sp. 32-45-6]|nr:MAG: hypothetical protein B7Z16_05035 [Algoriphagus sp. 32-45-6]
MNELFSFLLVFGVVLLAIAAFAKEEIRSGKSPYQFVVRYFGFIQNVNLAYLFLVVLSTIFAMILVSFFPKI